MSYKMLHKVPRKGFWLGLLTLTLALGLGAMGVGIVQAQESANYNLTINSLAGGNRAGGILSSASYRMVVSSGTYLKISSTSASYDLCSGFICQVDKDYFQIRLPDLSKTE